MPRSLALLLVICCLACDVTPQPTAEATRSTAQQAEPHPLAQTDGGAVVWQAIEASGGLTAWERAAGLSLRFARTATDRQALAADLTIALEGARVYQQAFDDSGVELTWTGESTWATPPETAFDDPRYWSVMPYYVVAMPWLLAWEPADFQVLRDVTLDGVALTAVSVVLHEVRGSAPQRFVLLFDKQTHRVRGMRYALRFEGCNPEGGPEHLTKFDGEVVVDGVMFPATYQTFRTDETTKAPTEPMWTATLSDVAFLPTVDGATFAMPEAAKEYPHWE